MTEPDHDALMMAHLLRELEPHGVGADRITIEYQDDLQDYDVLITGGELTQAQISGLSDATRMGGCVRFSDARNTDLWYAHLGREGRKMQIAEARRKHPDLPRFDPARQTLAEFVRALEIWLGATPGSTLTVTGGKSVLAELHGLPQDLDAMRKHMIVMAALSEADVEVSMFGADVHDD